MFTIVPRLVNLVALLNIEAETLKLRKQFTLFYIPVLLFNDRANFSMQSVGVLGEFSEKGNPTH